MFGGPVPGILGATIEDASDLPRHLPNATRFDPWTESVPGTWMLALPRVARYLIQDGTRIRVEAEPDADPASVELFLHGSARGFLIHQRGEPALEAATLAAPHGGAVAVAGYSGCGKSTLAAELCRHGWRLVADDITRVTFTGGRALAWPSHEALKLWHDACETFGIDTETLPRARRGMEKFYVKMPATSQPTVLRNVIRLDMNAESALVDIPASHNAAMLSECTFRRLQMKALGRQPEHERIVRQVAGAIRMMRLAGARTRPHAALAAQIVRTMS